VGEIIDPTWVAYSSPAPIRPELLQAGLDRVAGHYERTAAGELRERAWLTDLVGLACWEDSARTCRWPGVVESWRHVVTTAYVPTGWRRIVAVDDPADASLALAAKLEQDPSLVARSLDPPAVVVVGDKAGAGLTICNDCLGAGRLYEARSGDLVLWSNRLGALPLLLGEAPRADSQAWELFAAMGWFIRASTPFAGVERVGPGTVIRAGGGTVTSSRTDAVGSLVAGGEADLKAGIEQFVDEATDAARAAADLFPADPRVDVSGGRDSRLAAAVFVAADVGARYVTSDMTPGEADVARRLFSELDGDYDHEVRWGGSKAKSYDKGLRERAAAIHLVHDGVRHAAKVRGKMALPFRPTESAEITGHGGEIAHGFYYTSQRALGKLRGRGEGALLERLDQAARRRHEAGRAECYERAHAACEASLREGTGHGVEGPSLLDWFYLMERFSHRSGLAADTQRITFFSCQGFVRSAFALTPEERLDNRLHREATAALVPSWERVPYFKIAPAGGVLARLRGRRFRAEKRPMIWEGSDGDELEATIAADGAWSSIYDGDRVREIWASSRAGQADAHFQDVFEGIIYREAFEDHLALLAAEAAVGPPLRA